MKGKQIFLQLLPFLQQPRPSKQQCAPVGQQSSLSQHVEPDGAIASRLFDGVLLFFNAFAIRSSASVWVVGIGFLLVLGLLWFAGGYLAVWLWPDSDWTNRWRYSLDDDLKDATIVIGPILHDCEFFTSPIGSKHCHYEKQVATIRIRTDASGRLVSVDEGKTWAKAQPFDKPAVYVTWNKILD